MIIFIISHFREIYIWDHCWHNFFHWMFEKRKSSSSLLDVIIRCRIFDIDMRHSNRPCFDIYIFTFDLGIGYSCFSSMVVIESFPHCTLYLLRTCQKQSCDIRPLCLFVHLKHEVFCGRFLLIIFVPICIFLFLFLFFI